MKWAVVVFLFTAAYANHEIYAGWKSYIVEPSTEVQIKGLHAVSAAYNLDFWITPTLQREGIVIVQPQYQEEFLKTLDNLQITYRTHVDDVKAQLEYEFSIIEETRNASRPKNLKELPFDNYQTIETIYEYLVDIANRYPETVTLVTPANSFEGRPLYYLKISTTNFEDERKPVIVIDGGIHAREWVSPPTVLWAIKKLVEDVTEPDLLERFDWIIMPVVNPDGYEFSRNVQAMWRKTRSTDQHPLSYSCPGVDGNRNYDFFWGTVSTHTNPCSEEYGGSRAFSEIETRVVRDILIEHLPRIALYITVHSYGSMILYPWGHDGSLSYNAFALHLVGVNMAEEIDRHSLPYFPRYLVGNAALVLWYGASGASEDYAHSIGVPLSYTYELPGINWDGFFLQPRYIEQVCRETWEGFVVGARNAGDLFLRKN